KTADPDPKIPPACKPPPIRDKKTESANPRYGEGFFSKLLDQRVASVLRFRSSQMRLRHNDANFGIGTLARKALRIVGVRRCRLTWRPPRARLGAKWGRRDRVCGTAFGRAAWQAGPLRRRLR